MFAELQFYEENSTSIVKGWVIGSEKIYKKDPNMTREKAFDRSRLTIFHVEKLDGGVGWNCCFIRIFCRDVGRLRLFFVIVYMFILVFGFKCLYCSLLGHSWDNQFVYLLNIII